MFEDFVPCHVCKHYDAEKHYCKLFLRTVVEGCPNGEENDDGE